MFRRNRETITEANLVKLIDDSFNQIDPAMIQQLVEPRFKKLQDELDSQLKQLRQMIRPVAWEDDFSKNTKDKESFENGKPISKYSSDDIRKRANQFDSELFQSVDLKTMALRDTYPIPADDDREGYLPGYDMGFWISGLSDYLKVANEVRKQGLDVSSVLDFGCASGRVARHFCIQSEYPEIWASEINYRHIRWLSQYMPANLKPIHTPVIPMLPIADGSIDLICAFSVFTHIDTFETAWLAELNRVLSPNGLCYFTVHNNDTWRGLKELGLENRLVKRLLKNENFQRSQLFGEIPGDRLVYRHTEKGPYRAQVFHSNDFLKQVWGRFFEIHDIIPNHHGRQAVVVMRKAAKSASKNIAA